MAEHRYETPIIDRLTKCLDKAKTEEEITALSRTISLINKPKETPIKNLSVTEMSNLYAYQDNKERSTSKLIHEALKQYKLLLPLKIIRYMDTKGLFNASLTKTDTIKYNACSALLDIIEQISNPDSNLSRITEIRLLYHWRKQFPKIIGGAPISFFETLLQPYAQYIKNPFALAILNHLHKNKLDPLVLDADFNYPLLERLSTAGSLLETLTTPPFTPASKRTEIETWINSHGGINRNMTKIAKIALRFFQGDNDIENYMNLIFYVMQETDLLCLSQQEIKALRSGYRLCKTSLSSNVSSVEIPGLTGEEKYEIRVYDFLKASQALPTFISALLQAALTCLNIPDKTSTPTYRIIGIIDRETTSHCPPIDLARRKQATDHLLSILAGEYDDMAHRITPGEKVASLTSWLNNRAFNIGGEIEEIALSVREEYQNQIALQFVISDGDSDLSVTTMRFSSTG